MFVRVFLVFGKPGVGKSTFCSSYCAAVAGSRHFNLDTVFLDPLYLDASVTDIAQHINAGCLDKNLFMDIFSAEFSGWYQNLPDYTICDVLIEGYELYSVEEEMRRYLAGVKVSEVVKVELENYAITYKTQRIRVGVRDDFSEVIKQIRAEDYKELRPSINYQTFEDLEEMSYSRSLEKLKASGLALLSGGSFLKYFMDVGCNNGYVCFRAADMFGDVVGVDSCAGALSVAQGLNNHVYRIESVRFQCTDFYSMVVFPETVDIIYCSSFLHYSIGEGRVLDFFSKCHSILRDSGVLVLEVELYPHMEGRRFEVCGRPAGGEGSYPNLPWVLEHTKGLFSVTYLAQSLFQPGSNYDRYFFHFTKR